MIIESLTSGVITVGNGRGFVVEGAGERLVITAAHCLPSLPPALSSFGIEFAHLRAAPRPPRGGTPCVGGVSVRRSNRRHSGARFPRQSARRRLQCADGDGDGAFIRRCRAPPGKFLGAGEAAVARRPLVLLHDPPLRRAAVDHPCCRAGAWRNVGLADCRRGRHGGRGYLHHDIAQRRRPQRAPFPQPAGMAAPRHFLGGRRPGAALKP